MGNNIFDIPSFKPVFSTEFGAAYLADSIQFLKQIPSDSLDLIMTSPPFALLKKKTYGNEEASNYVQWFIDNFATELFRVLKPTGSLVIDIGGTWNPKSPTRSLYHFELLLRLCSQEIGFKLAQEFYWYNSAKMPSPAQYVNIERSRVKDAVNPIWWLSKTDRPKADNRRVLTPYKSSMKKLLVKGYNDGPRPSGHKVSKVWGKNNGGAIPPNIIGYQEQLMTLYQDNLLEIANTRSKDRYLEACKRYNVKPHPARFPLLLPSFFINFLTEPGDIVFDPFGGSCVTGEAAEKLQRRWFTSEINEEYVSMSRFRFENYTLHNEHLMYGSL
ncbi:DNA-methyltransferase [Paenibacillus sp. SAFN-117]|uniref:DNA-methyltransferase n=1 Tax=Paenibacillus sp. SAFN-117 TaxID=3436860 RepID=UPI003F800122